METTMKQIIALGAIVALLGGCSSLGKKDFTEIKKVDNGIDAEIVWGKTRAVKVKGTIVFHQPDFGTLGERLGD